MENKSCENKYRIEKDSMGEIKVPSEVYWAAQTQRSFENFKIGTELMPKQIIKAIAIIKTAAAKANFDLGKLDEKRYISIENAGKEIIKGNLDNNFPLLVWQTGSGTQTNMNLNEVIANYANFMQEKDSEISLVHPNDHVNMSQSSNDVFPSAIHVAGVIEIVNNLLPELKQLSDSFRKLEKSNLDIIKTGRTHLQDATPISFAQEVSGWRSMLEMNYDMILSSLNYLKQLAIGGTAVGTGLNAPEGFAEKAVKEISNITNIEFVSQENKFHALTSKDAVVYTHGALKALAANLMKIANDIRYMASGPRCGLGEITIPENEPGSSIMPGKVNPTQCEAITMVACQVMGNDATIGFAASQGNFELNVYMPVCAYNLLQSITLLSSSISSFRTNCVDGIKVNKEKMKYNLDNSLMLITALNPHIGYDNGAKIAKLAYKENISLKEATVKLGILSEEEFDKLLIPEDMI